MDKQGQFKQPDQPSPYNQQLYTQGPYWDQQSVPYPQPLPQSSHWQAQVAFPSQAVSPLSPPRNIIRRAFKVLLYFTGIFIGIFGMFAVAEPVSNKSYQVESIGMAFGVVAAGLSIFIFFQKKYTSIVYRGLSISGGHVGQRWPHC